MKISATFTLTKVLTSITARPSAGGRFLALEAYTPLSSTPPKPMMADKMCSSRTSLYANDVIPTKPPSHLPDEAQGNGQPARGQRPPDRGDPRRPPGVGRFGAEPSGLDAWEEHMSDLTDDGAADEIDVVEIITEDVSDDGTVIIDDL